MYTPKNLTARLFASSLIVGCLGLLGTAAQANDFPNRPINLYVSAAPGGTTDIAARMIAEPLARALGTSVIVDNRPGGSGGVAAQQVSRAPADGYTLLFQYSGFQVISPLLLKNQNWDPVSSFSPVANVLSAPQLLVVRSTLPYKTLEELVNSDAAKKGELNYASSGVGSLQHVATELFNQMAETQLFHIPYNGTGPALNDLMGGAVDLTMTTPPPLLPHIQNGNLTPLVVTGPKRLDSLPDVPTASEAGYPELEISSWFAMYAPAGTPADVVNKIAAEVEKITQTAEFQEKAQSLGAYPSFQGPAELGEYTKAELSRWGKVIEAAQIEMP
ncbi:Bug family tripartite tricarboxylate transporter substrate binding protein [Alcaligenes endophyticus]|uniref:Bug family tripartite tricarboxylate transporter substrate binding protein n=1 Tax=Alcaligenes endophyticus TaxID=1929088 RepID=UPI003606E9FE